MTFFKEHMILKRNFPRKQKMAYFFQKILPEDKRILSLLSA